MFEVFEIDLVLFQEKGFVFLGNDVLAVVTKCKGLYTVASDNQYSKYHAQ